MSRFIAIANQKGGVGKTTTAVNLAASLAQLGQRILVLDMDPQGNASSGFGVSANSLQRGVYEVLMGSAPIEEAIYRQASPGLDLLPSGQRLIGAEVELVSALARERILEKSIHPIRDQYDIFIADCPPSLGLLTVNTLTAADSVLIPIQCEYYALEGVTQLMNAIRLIQQALNPRLDIEGILLTMFDARLNLSREVMEEARKFFSGKVYETVIPRNVRLSEAPSFGKPVLQYDPECAGAQFYLKLAREVLGLPPDADARDKTQEVGASGNDETHEVAAGETVGLAEPQPTLHEPHVPTVEVYEDEAHVVTAEAHESAGIVAHAEPVSDRDESLDTLPVSAVDTTPEPVVVTAFDTPIAEHAVVETDPGSSREASEPVIDSPTELPITDSPATDPPQFPAEPNALPAEPVTQHETYPPAPIHASFDAIVTAYTDDVSLPANEMDSTDEIIVLSEDAIVPSSESHIETPPEPNSEGLETQHIEPGAIEDEPGQDPVSEPTNTTEAHPQEELVSHD